MFNRVKGKASSSWYGFHIDNTETIQSDQTINAHMQARKKNLTKMKKQYYKVAFWCEIQKWKTTVLVYMPRVYTALEKKMPCDLFSASLAAFFMFETETFDQDKSGSSRYKRAFGAI